MTLRSLRKEEDRRRLYAVALELIQDQGYEATTIRDIAARAGMAVGTFFNHFPSKEHLLVDYYVQLQQEVASRLGKPRRTFAAFVKVFRGLVLDEVRTHPHLYRAIGVHLLTSGALQAAEQATCGDMHLRLSEAAARGQASGELRTALTPDEIASLILLAFNGAILEALPDFSGEAFEVRVHHYLDPLLRLLRA